MAAKHLKNNKELVTYTKTLFMAATEGKHTYSNKQIADKAGKKFDVEINYTTIGRWSKSKKGTGLSWKEQFDLALQEGLGLEPDNELESLKIQLLKQTEQEYNQLLESQNVGDRLQHLILTICLTTIEAVIEKGRIEREKGNKDFDLVKEFSKCLPEKITKLLPHVMLNITNRVKVYRDAVAGTDGEKPDKTGQDIKQAIQEARSLM
jgi:hypothetical protein